jgi:putative membrane protein
MNRTLTLSAMAALALGATACQQQGTTVSENQPQAEELNVSDEPGVENMTASSAVPTAPAFAAAAAGSDLFEIESGKLAQAKGSSAGVKRFGAELVSEHTKSSNELKAAVARLQPPVALPTAPPIELQTKLQTLQGLSGEAFDRQFIADQTVSHKQTLTALNGYIASGDNPALREWAQRASGMVQKHLQQLDRMSTGNASQ